MQLKKTEENYGRITDDSRLFDIQGFASTSIQYPVSSIQYLASRNQDLPNK